MEQRIARVAPAPEPLLLNRFRQLQAQGGQIVAQLGVQAEPLLRLQAGKSLAIVLLLPVAQAAAALDLALAEAKVFKPLIAD